MTTCHIYALDAYLDAIVLPNPLAGTEAMSIT